MLTFAERLKALRKGKGMSQNDLAQRLGVIQQTVATWENEVAAPGQDMLCKIANEFQVSVDYLLGRSNIPAYERISTVMKMIWGTDFEQVLSNPRILDTSNVLTNKQMKQIISVLPLMDEWGLDAMCRLAESQYERVQATQKKEGAMPKYSSLTITENKELTA